MLLKFLRLLYGKTLKPLCTEIVAMHLADKIERTTESRYILDGRGPQCAQYWAEYKDFEAMLSERHSVALYMATQAKQRGEISRKFSTDVPRGMLDHFVISAPTLLRKLDKDIQTIINQGGNDAIVYLKTLSTLRAALTDTITNLTRLVGS